MTISTEDLRKIAQLAYLNTDADQSSRLHQEINEIMDFVEQLHTVDTAEVAPLFHPLAINQHLRADVVTEKDCVAELEELAPLFDEHLYLVPQVLEDAK